MTDDVADRADRLGAALLVLGLVREPGTEALEASAEIQLLTADEWDSWRNLDDDDIALVHACLNVEFELRSRGFAALQRFGAAWSTSAGATPEEHIASISADAARETLAATFALGWNYPVPAEGEADT